MNEEIEEELNKYKKIVNKFGGIEELEKYILYISKYLGDIPVDCILPTLKSSYISKDKIRAKIEEYKKLLQSCNKFSDLDRIKSINERILSYKELLEEE